MPRKPREPSSRPARKPARRRGTVAERGPHPIDLVVGTRVRIARLLAGRTQQWLAERTRITFQQIQKYELGVNRISCSMLAEFAAALAQPPEWFFEAADAEPARLGELLDRQRLVYELTSNFQKIRDDAACERIVALVRAIGDATEAAAGGATGETGTA